MKSYTFLFFRPQTPVPSLDIAVCADHDEARSCLEQLTRARPDCRHVQIWDEHHLVEERSWDPAQAVAPPRRS